MIVTTRIDPPQAIQRICWRAIPVLRRYRRINDDADTAEVRGRRNNAKSPTASRMPNDSVSNDSVLDGRAVHANESEASVISAALNQPTNRHRGDNGLPSGKSSNQIVTRMNSDGIQVQVTLWKAIASRAASRMG